MDVTALSLQAAENIRRSEYQCTTSQLHRRYFRNTFAEFRLAQNQIGDTTLARQYLCAEPQA
jgi:hypothetical protein